jgi:hypothetical protein
MKYIITENRLDEFLTEYLNDWLEDKYVNDRWGDILIYNRVDDEDDSSYSLMDYDISSCRLSVNYNIKKTLEGYSGKNHFELNSFIKNWFENKFNVPVIYVD